MADSPVTDACINCGRSKPIDHSVNFYYTHKKATLLLRWSLYYALDRSLRLRGTECGWKHLVVSTSDYDSSYGISSTNTV
jgi:hypothetical protein